MMSRYKNEFLGLLKRISDSLESRGDSDNGTPLGFDETQETFAKIQRDTSLRVEDIRAVSDILHRSDDHQDAQDSRSVHFRLAADRFTHVKYEFSVFAMKEKMIPFAIQNAERLFEQGNIQDALMIMENLYQSHPDHKIVSDERLEMETEARRHQTSSPASG